MSHGSRSEHHRSERTLGGTLLSTTLDAKDTSKIFFEDGQLSAILGDKTSKAYVDTAIANKANIASPRFTGILTAGVLQTDQLGVLGASTFAGSVEVNSTLRVTDGASLEDGLAVLGSAKVSDEVRTASLDVWGLAAH
ncbi:hypothetical protein T492DRAFT_849786 [Pavlovales sp. CCMP2436]|nr:hypothetical protein T492DRAFT_849786 [Pavlovales sp. CCMP2436]